MEKGFVQKNKQFIKVLEPGERKIKDIEESQELIDVLHHVLLLWKKGEKDKLLARIPRTRGSKEIFYRVAQEISQALPASSREKNS